jgi:FkbM family methyltransferase
MGLRSGAAEIDAAPSSVPTDVPPAPTELEKFFLSLQRIGFEPAHVLDVGANRGGWTRTALQYFPHAHYTLVEPQPQMREMLLDLLSSNPKIQLHTVGAGPVKTNMLFTIHDRDDSCTFSLSREQAAERGFSQVTIPVMPVDDLLALNDWPSPEIVKIDAEGFDLEVLKGANNAVGKCEIVLIEAAIMNKSFANDLLSVTSRLVQLGFRPLDFTDLNRTQLHGSLWLVEMAFARVGGFVDRQINSYS